RGALLACLPAGREQDQDGRAVPLVADVAAGLEIPADVLVAEQAQVQVAHRARYPPSTGMMAPVVLDDRSDARKRAALAQSSGVLARPVGTNEPHSSISSCDRSVEASSSERPKLVSRVAGAMALTRMSSLATSIASDL